MSVSNNVPLGRGGETLESMALAAYETLQNILEASSHICERPPPYTSNSSLSSLITKLIEQCRVVGKQAYRPDNEKHRRMLLVLEKKLPELPKLLDEYDKAYSDLEREKKREKRAWEVSNEETRAKLPAPALDGSLTALLQHANNRLVKWQHIREPVQRAEANFKCVEQRWFEFSKLMEAGGESLRLMAQQPEPAIAAAAAAKRWTLKEANDEVMKWVHQKATPSMRESGEIPSSREISRGTGIPVSTVQRTDFYREAMQSGHGPARSVRAKMTLSAGLADPSTTALSDDREYRPNSQIKSKY